MLCDITMDLITIDLITMDLITMELITMELITMELQIKPPDKSVYLKIISLMSQPKHMLWVLKRTVSLRRFF